MYIYFKAYHARRAQDTNLSWEHIPELLNTAHSAGAVCMTSQQTGNSVGPAHTSDTELRHLNLKLDLQRCEIASIYLVGKPYRGIL
jgi:hypothetical protein